MGKLSYTNKALLLELETYLKRFDEVQKEKTFNKIMPTKRLFRCDYLLPNLKIIVEVNGGQWNNGRHNRGGKGYENDLMKLNIAQKNGYKVYQFTYEMLIRMEYRDFIC